MKGAKKSEFAAFSFSPIAWVETCFQDKFGVPRQPRLIPAAEGVIRFKKSAAFQRALEGLEVFTHVWVLFVFHENEGWKPTVRPPRLGGARKMGVFATRSPHRPNSIGMSVMKVLEIGVEKKVPFIRVQGVDLVNGTPVLDIKPYVPYADSVPEAGSGWAEEPIERVPVRFADEALEQIRGYEGAGRPRLGELAMEILTLDPRPAFQQRKIPWKEGSSQGRKFGFRLYDLDIRWEIRPEGFWVREVVPYSGKRTKSSG